MPVFSTGAIENRNREMKSLAVRAANIGTDSADVMLEVFRAVPSAGEGQASQELYVQRLVAVEPNRLQTFDNIFADLDAVTVNVTTSGPGANTIAVTVAARDAQQRAIPGFVCIPPNPVFPSSGNGG